MQIMVTQKGFHSIAQRHATAQHLCRLGATVYQIAQLIQRVTAGGEVYVLQQALPGTVASLDVTD